VNFTRAVAGQHHDGRLFGFDGAKFRDGDLVVGQHFQQEGFKGLVSAVQLVNQEHRGNGLGRVDGLQQGAADQKAVAEKFL
jgi:hypothetical protein